MNKIYGKVLDESLKQSKFGHYVIYKLKTVEGTVKAIKWDVAENFLEDSNFPHVGEFLFTEDYQDERKTYGNIKLNSCKKVAETNIPEEFASITKIPAAPMVKIQGALRTILDKSNFNREESFNLVRTCYLEIAEPTLLSCPGGERMHHAESGGLIIHVSEVLLLAKSLTHQANLLYDIIDSDVVLVSAALHDIGKFTTYYINQAGFPEKRTIEKSVGHAAYSLMSVDKNGRALGVRQEFLDEVLHCIASHHGSPDWGAYKTPQSLEAVIVHQADYLSAMAGSVIAEIENLKAPKDVILARGKIDFFNTLAISDYFNRKSEE